MRRAVLVALLVALYAGTFAWGAAAAVDCSTAFDPQTCQASQDAAASEHDDVMLLIGVVLGAGFLPVLLVSMFGGRS
jgi:hypothetical protein